MSTSDPKAVSATPLNAQSKAGGKQLQSTKTTHKKRRWLIGFILVAVAAVVLWIGLLARDALLLRDDVQALQDYAASLPRPLSPQQIDVRLIQQRINNLHANLSALRQHAAPLLAIAPALGWIPNVGGDIQNAPELLDFALQSADMSRRGLDTIAPFWPPTADGHLSLPKLVSLLQALQPSAASFRGQLDRAAEIRSTIDATRLSPRLQSLIKQFDGTSPLARAGLDLLAVAPELLGADRPRTFLILIQNEDELRATGGFISAAGRVTIDQGKVISLTVEDSYAIDDFKTPYPDAPAPMNDYMGIDLWVFRDSNWSPDFPTAARQAMKLYQQTRPGTIDGVIGVDQRVVEAIVEGAGPLTLDGQTLATAADLQAYMRQSWSPSGQSNAGEWMTQRKSFIGRGLQTLLERFMSGQVDVNWQKLGHAIAQVLRSRDLLFYFTAAQAGQSMSRAQLDGALRISNSDYLMMVDSNMGFNKASVAIQQALTYSVTLSPDRAPQATLTIVYTNTNPANGPCLPRPPIYDLNTTYDQLVQQCYWLYRRVLTPPGSQLDEASRHPATARELVTGQPSDGATRVVVEDGKTVFGTFLIVPRQQRVDSFVSYTLPASVVQHDSDQLRYHLVWQKQSGASAWPIRITVQWPSGWRLRQALPQPLSADDRSASFEFALDRDQEIDVILGEE